MFLFCLNKPHEYHLMHVVLCVCQKSFTRAVGGMQIPLLEFFFPVRSHLLPAHMGLGGVERATEGVRGGGAERGPEVVKAIR